MEKRNEQPSSLRKDDGALFNKKAVSAVDDSTRVKPYDYTCHSAARMRLRRKKRGTSRNDLIKRRFEKSFLNQTVPSRKISRYSAYANVLLRLALLTADKIPDSKKRFIILSTVTNVTCNASAVFVTSIIGLCSR